MKALPDRPLLVLALPLALMLGSASSPAASEVRQQCPDLITATQVGNCPSEAELRHTFHGFCNDERHLYLGDAEVCTDYQAYRQLKNVAPWESADGEFMAYVSCELPAGRVQALRAQGIGVSRAGKITLLTCDYGDGVRFTHRSRLTCEVEGDGRCASGDKACQALCR